MLTGAPSAVAREATPAAPAPAAPAAAPGDTSFSIGTFNILGSQHTRGALPYGPGKERAGTTASLIEDNGIDVIGLQEVQPNQLKVLSQDLPGHDIWPGKALGKAGVRLQIAWNRDVFSLVSSGYIDTPFDRQVRPVPWVQLVNRASNRRMYVVDAHNSPGGLEKERDTATRQQLALVHKLRATRQAVFLVGDMNEKREVFCKVVGKAGLQAANGGVARSPRHCRPPGNPPGIDWIFGAGPVSFTGYQLITGGKARSASDHAIVEAQVSVRPRRG